MKNAIYKILLLVIVACTTACHSKVKVNNTVKISDDAVYNVNLDTLSEVELGISTVFGKIKAIILETNENSVLSRIMRMEISDNLIFILDGNPLYNLNIFDINGKFIRKIGNIGAGPGEYTYPHDFTIDTVRREIYLLFQHRYINKYSIDGKFINKITINTVDEFSNSIQYRNDKSLYVNLFNTVPTEEDDYMIKEIDPATGKTVSRFVKTAEYNKGWNDPNFYNSPFSTGFVSKLSESPKYIHLFTDKFLSFTEGNIDTYIAIQSKDLVSYSDIKKTEGKAAIERINTLRKDKIYGFYNYVETEKHINFGYSISTTMPQARLQNVLIDKQTKVIQKVLWTNDLVYSLKIHNPNFIFSDSNGIYEYVHFHRLLSVDTFKGILLPSVDKYDELQKLPEDANPVIFYYSYE